MRRAAMLAAGGGDDGNGSPVFTRQVLPLPRRDSGQELHSRSPQNGRRLRRLQVRIEGTIAAQSAGRACP